MSETFVIDAVRTPVGRYGGGLAVVRPDDLGAAALGGLLSRHRSLDPAEIDDVYFGNANGAGEENRNLARMSLLLAGLPPSVPGTTVNRLCGSGLEAVVQAHRAIRSGDAEICVAGGAESMSRAPWVVQKPSRPYPKDPETMYSTALGWRLVNPAMPSEWTVSLGEGAEILADRFQISREQQDEFALRSHRRAAAAWAAGAFAQEIVEVPGAQIEADESVRPDASAKALAKLKPVFREGGTVTAGNASPMNDAGAAALLGSEEAAAGFATAPLARIASTAVSAVEPQLYGIGPVKAAGTALRRAGIDWSDLAFVELNEAFAAQSLACLASWPELDPEIVNPNGGAIAIGHPIGASGGRILASACQELHRRGGGFALAAMCIGVGQGIAVVLEGTS